MSTTNYNQLIQKLDRFIRKYYTNKLIKGLLITTGIVVLYFLAIALLESQFYFDRPVRKFMFFSFVLVSLGSLSYLVFLPLIKLLKLGKTIDHEQAAVIIGDHFVDVKDKLVNVLQLKSRTDDNNELVIAGIEQKTEEIKLVPFSNAIDLSKNRRYMPYALPPLLLLLGLLVAAPSMIKSPTSRIIQNNKDFEPDAPFHYTMNQEVYKVVQNDNYTFEVSTDGEAQPDEIFIHVDDFRYRMKKTAPNRFQYTFNNVQKDMGFHLESGMVRSSDMKIKVLLKPLVENFSVSLDYPGYTGRKDEILANKGDFTVPVGTKVNWNFETSHTESIDVLWSGKRATAERKGKKEYSFNQRILSNGSYKLYLSNDVVPGEDSISYYYNVIPDNYPEISVERFVDSSNLEYVYFAGSARDDYGIRNLAFHYQIIRPDGQNGASNSKPMSIEKGRATKYRYEFDIAGVGLEPGESLNYYFEVADNDGVNGSKSSRTSMFQFSVPSIEEMEQQIEENKEQIKSELSEIKEESKKMKEELKKLREEIFQEKELEWQKKKEMEKLMERQKELNEKLQNASEKFKENQETQEELNEEKEENKKEEKLEELFDQAKNEELEELMKRIEELQQDIEKEEAIESLEEFEQQMEQTEFNMEKLLEMYKQMEVELELQKEVQELKELAKEQEKLAEETQEKEEGENNEEQQKKQEEINEKFEEIKKDIKETMEKNEELKKPNEIEPQEKNQEEVDKEQEKSMESMQEGKNQKAGESQKKAGEKMEDMAEEMESSMEQSQEQQMEEDMEMLRQLLENLMTLSFEQEDLIDEVRRSRANTPKYVSLLQEQKNIQDDFQVVEDTLKALSMRVTELETFITEKVDEINSNMEDGLEELEARHKSQASDHQQRTMKNLNDLALMLDESLKNMQQAMAKATPSAMCNNPGQKPGGKPGTKPGKVPADKMTESQQQLGKKMSDQMGKQKKGEKPGSKEFAEMAAQQAAIRKALEEKRQMLGEKGKGTKSLDKLVQDMDKIETDLVNKKLTNEMLQRQENILTRLLEEERAEREREYDNKRQAEQGENMERKVPASLDEYLKQRESEIDVYKTISPELRAYYKALVEKYYQRLKE